MSTLVPTHPWPVYGHDWAVDHLRKSLMNDRARHAYLFTGVSNIGKSTLAHAFARAVNCTHADEAARPCGECRSCFLVGRGSHPDIIYPPDDPKSSTSSTLKIDAVRDVTGKLFLKPFEARYRVAIIEDFERAQPRTQDALLKTLEEPASTAMLLLTARSTDGILSTITSRCQVMNLRPLSTDALRRILETRDDVAPPEADLLARVSGGRIGWALSALQGQSIEQREAALTLLEDALRVGRVGRFDLAKDLGKDKAALLQLLELWTTYWRDLVILTQGATLPLCNIDREPTLHDLAAHLRPEQALTALRATRKTINDVSRTNVNVRLALEVMFLDYPL